MSRASEDDREAVDRAFADLVAGYHLTADRPDPLLAPPVEAQQGNERDENWADEHPLFRAPEPQPAPPPPAPPPAPRPEPVVEREPEPRYVPDPLPPLGRPAIPALVGWVAIGYAVLLVLGATFGIRFPMWAGWLAVISFIGGFGILVTRLPRNRPPDAGDGAVL
ncbi:MAG TPA: hypothetical protein VLJ88_12195 [Propionibacteriaceae bacterium]|nr:hypothetical protein [Propionibacteriaceae bacterium]